MTEPTLIGPVRHHGCDGYLKPNGAFVIVPEYSCLGDLSEDRICFLTKRSIGFLDVRGEVVIPPNFDTCEWLPVFKGGLAAVKHNGRMGYINLAGEWQIEPTWCFCWDFNGAYSLVESEAGYFVINRSGDKISKLNAFEIQRISNWIGDWHCIRCVFYEKGKGYTEGCLNWRGEVVFAPDHEELTDFCDGVAGYTDMEANLDALWGLVDFSGRILKPPQFYGLQSFSEGLAAAGKELAVTQWVDRYGYINGKGDWVVAPEFTDADMFCGGLACVGVGKKKNRYGEVTQDARYGFIDKIGRMVIEPSYSKPGKFVRGFATMQRESQSFVIDKQGTIIWEGAI
jgi:hypothetical protein